MRDSRPRPLHNLCCDATETSRVSLSQIQQRTIMLLNLNRAVNALLPARLRPWCRVANVRQGVMVMDTANATWLMRLRYEQPQLLSALRSRILPSLSSIDIRINPGLARKQECSAQNSDSCQQIHQHIKEETKRLSVQSANSIRRVAASSEKTLKNALERLAELAGESARLPSLPPRERDALTAKNPCRLADDAHAITKEDALNAIGSSVSSSKLTSSHAS